MTQLVQFAITFSYIQFFRPGVTKESWIAWDWAQSTTSLESFLELALPCAMSMWAEWWCAEVMTLLVGYIGVTALAAHTSAMWVFVLIYMTAGGIGCAGAALVGNALGAKDARLAKRSAIVASMFLLAVCIVIDVALYFGSPALARVFAMDEEVRHQIRAILHVLLLVVPADSLQTVIDGILRGLGKQSTAFKVKLCCLWGIRLPLAWYLGLHTAMGVTGIWWGSVAGLFATMVIYLCLVSRIDWQAEVDALGSHYARMPTFSTPHSTG